MEKSKEKKITSCPYLSLTSRKEPTAKEQESAGEETRLYGLDRYIILFALLAFIGWAFEVGVMFVQTGKFYNQGFNTLPVCPIYAGSLLVCYFLLGTPDYKKGILRRVNDKKKRYALYLLFAFFIPTFAELLVGFVFDTAFSMRLWSYAGFPFNYKGYICLPVSLAWSALIFLFMKYIFPKLYFAVGKTPKGFSGALAFAITLIMLADFSLNLAYALYA